MIPSTADLAHLSAIIADRTRLLKHIRRARIVLLSVEHLPVLEVAERACVSRPAVWRWEQRYAEDGVEGLLRDKTRPPEEPPHSRDAAAEVLALTCSEPPGEVTHWTGRALADAVGISLRSVQRICVAHRLQPHRVRSFKRSTAPAFAAKVDGIVGLYMDPPRDAVVLSLDEKSQILALERTRPSRPSSQAVPRPRRTTTSGMARRRCLPRSTCWRGPCSTIVFTCSIDAFRLWPRSYKPLKSARLIPPPIERDSRGSIGG